MVTQSGDPNNKSKHSKNIVPIVKKTITVYQIVIKNNAMMNIKDIKIKYQELLSNFLYNTFVVNPVIHKKVEINIKMNTLIEIMTVTDTTKITTITRIDIEIKAEIIHKTIIDLILDKDITIDLQVHIQLDPDMTIIIKEELHLGLHIDYHTQTIPIIDTILDQYTDLVPNHKETPLDDTIIRTDPHLDQKLQIKI